MLTLDVRIGYEKFRLPDNDLEQNKPMLRLIHLGIVHIFKPVLNEYPGHKILAIWDEGLRTLRYESDTLTRYEIRKVLVASHGNIFD
jgi:hypothetical protein